MKAWFWLGSLVRKPRGHAVHVDYDDPLPKSSGAVLS